MRSTPSRIHIENAGEPSNREHRGCAGKGAVGPSSRAGASPRGGEAGLSVLELLIATAITVVAITVVIQTLILTMRTTEQTASQTDVQQQVRVGLGNTERELRDGYAILASFTPQNTGATAGATTTTYTTSFDWYHQTVVAAVPTIDTAGAPCAFQGVTLAYDVCVWQAARDNATGLWKMTRKTYPHAYEMPATYFHACRPRDWPFRTLLLAQTMGTPTISDYTLPATFGRTMNDTGQALFQGAGWIYFFLYHRSDTEYPLGGMWYGSPSAITVSGDLPKLVTATGLGASMPVTNAGVVDIYLGFGKNAPSLQTIRSGTVYEYDQQNVSIQLRNKPGSW